MGGALNGVPGLRPDWSIQTHVLLSSTWVLSKACTRERPWEVEDTVAHEGCWGNLNQELKFTCDSVGC